MVIIPPYDMNEFDKKINTLYGVLSVEKTLEKKIKIAADSFLGLPYCFEPLGEGPEAKYYQEPLYRTDKFDCVTFTDTILALVHSQDLSQFRKHILQIRYQHHEINYINRTDWFTDLEWIPHVQALGWIKNVTNHIVDTDKKNIAVIASTLIDKPNWYKVKSIKALHMLKPLSEEEASTRLTQLRAEGKAFTPKESSLSYLPLSQLFDSHEQPNDYLFKQIPTGSVIAVVRPNWSIRDNFTGLEGYPEGYGTNLNVSHVGIAIRTTQDFLFYHATKMKKMVVCESLSDYLKNFLHNETVKGIHVEQIV